MVDFVMELEHSMISKLIVPYGSSKEYLVGLLAGRAHISKLYLSWLMILIYIIILGSMIAPSFYLKYSVSM